jgi:tetratricopeptide (TPR) repeat protein
VKYTGTGATLKGERLYNESLSLLLENGDYHGELPWLYRNMAEVEMQLKNYSKAEELYIKSLQLRREYKLHTLMYVFLVFEGLAAIASELEQQERAARLFGAAERLLEITGSLISKCDDGV